MKPRYRSAWQREGLRLPNTDILWKPWEIYGWFEIDEWGRRGRFHHILTLLFLLVTLSARAQTTTWSTYAGTVKDPVITFTQFGNGWNIAINGTNAKYYLANFKCPACPVCPPEKVCPTCPPPINCDLYSPYQASLQVQATLIDQLAKRNKYADSLTEANYKLTRNYQQALQVIREQKAERAKYKQFIILVDTTK